MKKKYQFKQDSMKRWTGIKENTFVDKKELKEKLIHGLEKYPEYASVVRKIVRDIDTLFRKYEKEIDNVQKESKMIYGQQFTLEEVIKKLQESV